MEIRDKYNIEDSGTSLSIYPYRLYIYSSWQVIGGLTTAGIVLFFLRGLMDEVLWISLYVVIAYFILQNLYNVLVKANIRYTFCASANAVYRSTSFFQEKKIMTLDELVVFSSSEMGTWHYSIGAKKSHLVKNYTISEQFGSGSKSQEKQELFEHGILDKITTLKSRLR